MYVIGKSGNPRGTLLIHSLCYVSISNQLLITSFVSLESYSAAY